MVSFATMVLQLALALLMSVQSNSTTVSDAMRQQAIMVATQAIQIAEQALSQNGTAVTTTPPVPPTPVPVIISPIPPLPPEPSNNTLSVSQNGNMTSGSVVANSASTKIGSYVISNPTSEAVSISKIAILAGQNASMFQNLRLMTNGVVLGPVQITPTNNANVNFAVASSLVVPANGNIVLDVYADVLQSAQPGSTNTTGIAGCAATGQTTQHSFNCSQASGQTVTVAAASTSTQISVSPSSLIFSIPFGGAATDKQITLTNYPSVGAIVMRLYSGFLPNGADWLSFSQATANSGSNVSTMTVEANTTNLPVGVYNGSINITANGQSVTIPVTLTVASVATGGNYQLTVLSPAQNVTLQPGQTLAIQWQDASQFVGKNALYDVQVIGDINKGQVGSTEVGSSIVAVPTQMPNIRTLTWTVPAGYSGNYSVFVAEQDPSNSAIRVTATSPSFVIGTASANNNALSIALGNITSLSPAVNSASAKIGSYVVSNPSTEAVSISSVTISEGSNASMFQNLRLMTNGSYFGPVQVSLTNNNTVSITALGGSIVIPANGNLPLDFYADVLPSAQPGSTNTTGIVSCVAAGQTTHQSFTCPQINGQTVTIAATAS